MTDEEVNVALLGFIIVIVGVALFFYGSYIGNISLNKHCIDHYRTVVETDNRFCENYKNRISNATN